MSKAECVRIAATLGARVRREKNTDEVHYWAELPAGKCFENPIERDLESEGSLHDLRVSMDVEASASEGWRELADSLAEHSRTYDCPGCCECE